MRDDAYEMETARRHIDRAMRVMRKVQAHRVAIGAETSDVDEAIRDAAMARYHSSMAAINYADVPNQATGGGK